MYLYSTEFISEKSYMHNMLVKVRLHKLTNREVDIPSEYICTRTVVKSHKTTESPTKQGFHVLFDIKNNVDKDEFLKI